jgi:hypothetical protein
MGWVMTALMVVMMAVMLAGMGWGVVSMVRRRTRLRR